MRPALLRLLCASDDERALHAQTLGLARGFQDAAAAEDDAGVACYVATDFSAKMIRIARAKQSPANLRFELGCGR